MITARNRFAFVVSCIHAKHRLVRLEVFEIKLEISKNPSRTRQTNRHRTDADADSERPWLFRIAYSSIDEVGE